MTRHRRSRSSETVPSCIQIEALEQRTLLTHFVPGIDSASENLLSQATGPIAQQYITSYPFLSGGFPVKSTTKLNDLDTNIAKYVTGDRILIMGRQSSGALPDVEVFPIYAEPVFSTDPPATTFGDLIHQLKVAFSDATVSLDEHGYVRVISNAMGPSSLKLSLADESTNSGRSRFSQNTFVLSQLGRGAFKFTSRVEILGVNGTSQVASVHFAMQNNGTWSWPSFFLTDDSELVFANPVVEDSGIGIRMFDSNSPRSKPLFSAEKGQVFEFRAFFGQGTVVVGQYNYRAFGRIPDGDYSVEFYPQPIDAQNLSLSLRSTFLPVSIRNGAILRESTELSANVANDKVKFAWNGTLNSSDDGFEIWVNDVSRGTAQVVHEHVKSHGVRKSLPPGLYRAWVGLKDPETGITRWSPAKDFSVSSVAPAITSPSTTNATLRPLISWTGSATGKYEIWLSNLETGRRIALVSVDKATAWTANQDLLPGRYAVWVRELAGKTPISEWSGRQVFYQLEPTINVTGVVNPGLDQTPSLTWETRVDALSYEIFIARSGVPGAVYRKGGLTISTHRVPVPLGNGTFTVWVRAALSKGRYTAWGAGQTMMIGATVSVAKTGSVLTWNSAPTATHYELWIDYDGGQQAKQAKIVYKAIYTSEVFQLPPSLPAGKYRVWVRPIRAEAGSLYAGAWSAAVSFPLADSDSTADSLDFVLQTMFAGGWQSHKQKDGAIHLLTSFGRSLKR